MNTFLAFLPELVLLLTALALFVVCLGEGRVKLARATAISGSLTTILSCLLAFTQEGVLFSGAYQIDAYSQFFKLVIAVGFLLVLLINGNLGDIRADIRPEFFLFLTLSVIGLSILVSCIELITLVVALETSSFPLYLLVAMRREREGQKTQMESAIKYVMFGVAANGVMFFGLSYLYGLTGTTHLPVMIEKIQPLMGTPLAIAGLALAFCGLYYKLAVFPFHFWTPDVYQGASNETASLVASLPKIGALAVLVRFVALASPQNETIATLLAVLAGASMLYGNLVALVQKDFKRLLGFSAIAHAGYALVGFVALDNDGYSAALYYITGYLLMVLACFVVICKVSRDGTNVAIEELAGLHKRAPLLAVTLAVGVFALAGIPPFVGFTGKLTLLMAALSKGYLFLVIFAVVNTAIAIYYYLSVVREAWFRDPGELPAIRLDWTTRVVCVALMGGILLMGIAPNRVLNRISAGVTLAISSKPQVSAPMLTLKP